MSIIENTGTSYCPDRCDCDAHVQDREPEQEATRVFQGDEMSLAEFDQKLADVRRERIARETRAATISTYTGGAPPRARGKGEPEPENRTPEPSEPKDVERYKVSSDSSGSDAESA